MKVLHARVYDPSLEGKVEPPILHLFIDELPAITIQPESFAGGWMTSKSGPLVTFTRHREDGSLADVDSGDFNKRFGGRFPVCVEVVLIHGGEDGEEFETIGYSLPVERARWYLRKYDNDWHYVLDERSAIDGKLRWFPQEYRPRCRYWLDERICGVQTSQRIPINGVDLPYCRFHVERNNSQQARRRINRAS